MTAPKPITLEYIDPEDYAGPAPQPFAVIGAEGVVEAGPIAIADVTGLEARLAAIEAQLEAPEA